tara:strand:+ start:1359 stop:1775 length:417 start_codon:yes stop_codon:yes gene_type:complete
MKIDIKELREMIRETLEEAKASKPTDISRVRSFLEPEKTNKLRMAGQPERLSQTYRGPELDEPSDEEEAVTSAMTAYYGIGGGDPGGLYSKLRKTAMDHEKHLKALQSHRNAEKFNVDEILLTVKQLLAAIDKARSGE